MSLPKFLTWAGAVNYASGPDSGFPVEVQPPFTFWTPGVSLPAQSLNYVAGVMARSIATVPTATLNTWGAPETVSSLSLGTSTSLNCIAWDDVNKVWVACSSASPQISISLTDGDVWVQLSTSVPSVTVAIGPIPGGIGYSLPQTGATTIRFCDTTGSVLDSGTNLGMTASVGGVAVAHPVSGAVVGVLNDSAATRAFAYTTLNGTTVTNISGILPGSWTSAMGAMSYWTYANGPSNDIVVAFGTTATTGPSRLLHITWNGSAFAAADLTLPGGMSGRSLTGVAYNTSTGLWAALAYNGTDSEVWTSPDLVSWTDTNTLTGLVDGLTAVGPYWVFGQSFTFAGVTRWRGYVSTDLVSDFRGLGTTLVSMFSTATKIASGAGGVALFNNAGAQISRRIG